MGYSQIEPLNVAVDLKRNSLNIVIDKGHRNIKVYETNYYRFDYKVYSVRRTLLVV